MSEIVTEIEPVKRPRLKFIDMARSIAILLMLEGHFIDQTLGVNFRSPDPHFANPDYLVYDIWHLVRGYTSPMFLTMTGMVFVYLLYMNRDVPFFQNNRVKLGFRRVLELLFWGYLITPRGFHILQCIGFGILGLLLVFGLYKLTKVIPLWVYYFGFSLLIFALNSPISEIRIDGEKIPWPYNAPNFIQNMFNAPGGRSLFPFTPHLGYTFFGAGIGVVLHSIWINKSKWNIPLFLFLLGVILAFFSTDILYFLHYKFIHFFGFGIMYLAKANWLFENLGWILMILGFLSAIEKIFTIKDNIFIRIGQNTLSIFIVHMMILYGAIINVGIATYINRTHNALNPYEAAIYAALFICIFVIMIYFIKPLSEFYNKSLDVLFPIRKKYRK
ncbi:MAG: hypothetical protein ACK476_15570 [Fluviicola sp.]|jgi:hypothetical protein